MVCGGVVCGVVVCVVCAVVFVCSVGAVASSSLASLSSPKEDVAELMWSDIERSLSSVEMGGDVEGTVVLRGGSVFCDVE